MKFKNKILQPNISQSFDVQTHKVVFSKGPIHLLDCTVAMPSGKILSRQILDHPGSVVIIPRMAKDKYILIRQFRFAAKAWLWEWPAGGMERGETLMGAAKRECMEEIGYRPKKLTKILNFYPSPGISSEVMHLFLAEGLTPEKRSHDEDEEIEAHEFSSREIENLIRKGLIVDAKTILGFYYLNEIRKK